MGGGTLGVLALIAIVFGAITSNSMNDYTGSLAFQALGARVKRPLVAALVAVLAFAAILWMHAGDTAGKFANILLFIGYWIAPFCAIVMIDWHDSKERYTPSFLRNALRFRNLGSGWPAITAFVLGFGAMVPFMNTSIVAGLRAPGAQNDPGPAVERRIVVAPWKADHGSVVLKASRPRCCHGASPRLRSLARYGLPSDPGSLEPLCCVPEHCPDLAIIIRLSPFLAEAGGDTAFMTRNPWQ